MELEAGFLLDEDGQLDGLHIDSNVEHIFSRELQRLQQAAIQAALKELELRLNSELNADLAPFRGELEQLKEYQQALLSEKSRAEGWSNFSSALAVESRIKKELAEQQKNAAEQAAEKLLTEIEKISKPSLPKLPF